MPPTKVVPANVVNAVYLSLFLEKIKQYEPGIYRIILFIYELITGKYQDLNMKQIKNYNLLKKHRFTNRFCLSTARHFNSKQINEMLNIIKTKESKLFTLSDIAGLSREQIGNYVRLKIENVDYKNLSKPARSCTVEQIDNMIILYKNNFKAPNNYWYSINYSYDKNKIKNLVKLKMAGFKDKWCAKAVSNFDQYQTDRMIILKKDNYYLEDSVLYRMIKNFWY